MKTQRAIVEGNSQRNVYQLCVAMLMTVLMLVPQMMKADDGRPDQNAFYDLIEYRFDNYANSNTIPTFESANYTAVSGFGGVHQGVMIGNQDMSYLAFRFEQSRPTDVRMRWWYQNGGLHTELYGNNSSYSSNCPIFAILNLRAGDKVRIFCKDGDFNTGNNNEIYNLVYYSSSNNIHTVYEWGNDGDFYSKGGNPKLRHNKGYIMTSDGDFIIKSTGNVTITNIQIFKIKDANYTVTRGTSTSGNPTYTCTFDQNGRLPFKDVAVPYLLCSFGHANDFAIIDSHSGNGHYSFVFDYTMDATMRKDENSIPIGGTYYAFKPTAAGKITVNGFLENVNGSNANFYVFKYNLDNSIAYTANDFHYAWKSNVPFTFDVEPNYIYYLCEDARYNPKGRLHLSSFTFENTAFDVENIGVVINLAEGETEKFITKVNGVNNASDLTSTVKRVSSSINPKRLQLTLADYNGEKWLKLSGISFNTGKDKAGTIIYDVVAANGKGQATIVITIPYHANYGDTERDEIGNHTHGHIWDFSDPKRSDSNIGNCLDKNGNVVGTTESILSIGKASDGSSPFAQELARREWSYAQRVTGMAGGYHDPMYKNSFDMEADNADMIWETEGLIFNTEANFSCIYNEGELRDDSDGKGNPDRYVGLLPDANGKSSFTIPGLNVGDRVMIYMGSGDASGSNGCFFRIDGANDVSGGGLNPQGRKISKEYHVGGSEWDGITHGYTEYRGAYQFIKNSDNGDKMTFTLVGGSMCKLYSIRIYTGEKIYSNNVIRSSATTDSYQFLNTYKDGAVGAKGSQYWYQLHYRGKGENLGTPIILARTGNLVQKGYSVGADIFSSINDNTDYPGTNIPNSSDQIFYYKNEFYNKNRISIGHYVIMQTKVGDYGTVRLRVPCMSYKYDSEEYTTDYGDHNLNVNYLEKMDYPYTWDFTDLLDYADDSSEDDLSLEASNEYINNYVNQWSEVENGYGANVLNYTQDSYDYIMFFYGGQLFGGKKMFDETRGIGFSTPETSYMHNSALKILNDGLSIDDNKQGKCNFTLKIPEVPANAAVYVRAKKLSGTPNYQYNIGGGQNSNLKEIAVTGSDEVVYAMVNNTSSAADVNLIINKLKIKKIAVSTDPKSVNIKGYASESRNHAIDASLTSYFTGKDMKTYLVGAEPAYADRTLTLADIGSSKSNYVLPANTGCVLFNSTDEGELKIVDDKFHLFVPDMHDQTGKFASVTENNKWMKAQLTEAQIDMSEDGKTNYVLSYRHYKLNEDGSIIPGTMVEGDEMFYRVSKEKIWLRDNSAYLQLPTSKVKPSKENPTGSKQFTFSFVNWDDLTSVPTAIDMPSEPMNVDAMNGEWFNLNGQRLNGKPSASGLYIVNGKKVLVK